MGGSLWPYIIHMKEANQNAPDLTSPQQTACIPMQFLGLTLNATGVVTSYNVYV